MRILVSGMVAGVPRQGGAAWAVLQYVLGLRRLGHDVILVEQVDRLAPVASRFASITRQFGLDAALVERGSACTSGLSRARLEAGADLLLNLSGALTDDDLLDRVDRRVFVDLDPAFTQLWHAAEGIDLGLDRHHSLVTVGRLIGSSDCSIPDCGRPWITTAQPIVLEQWPFAERTRHRAATTVGHWRGYGSITYQGVHYGQRAHSMRPLFGLPGMTATPLLMALAIHEKERDDLLALDRHGWNVVDPERVASTPRAYRSFVRGSWAELSVAKQGYAASRCGWFSDRSVCYLASGRPVVAQETGFSEWLPTGSGLLSYTTPQQAAAALDHVRANYSKHRRAARVLAEDVFDSDRVLRRLLECL
jgi:hypothetical protein